jgi:hypothetical protein
MLDFLHEHYSPRPVIENHPEAKVVPRQGQAVLQLIQKLAWRTRYAYHSSCSWLVPSREIQHFRYTIFGIVLRKTSGIIECSVGMAMSVSDRSPILGPQDMLRLLQQLDWYV